MSNSQKTMASDSTTSSANRQEAVARHAPARIRCGLNWANSPAATKGCSASSCQGSWFSFACESLSGSLDSSLVIFVMYQDVSSGKLSRLSKDTEGFLILRSFRIDLFLPSSKCCATIDNSYHSLEKRTDQPRLFPAGVGDHATRAPMGNIDFDWMYWPLSDRSVDQ